MLKKELGVSLAAVTLANSLFSASSFAKANNSNLHRKIDLVVLGESGLTSGELLKKIENDMDFRHSIKHADFITMDTGSNDLFEVIKPIVQSLQQGDIPAPLSPTDLQILKERAGEISNNLPKIISEIKNLTDVPIAVYNMYNPVPPLDQLADLLKTKGYNDGQILYTTTILGQLNSLLAIINIGIIATVHESFTKGINIQLADAHTAFYGKQAIYILPGDVHPTIEGQRTLAEVGQVALKLN